MAMVVAGDGQAGGGGGGGVEEGVKAEAEGAAVVAAARGQV